MEHITTTLMADKHKFRGGNMVTSAGYLTGEHPLLLRHDFHQCCSADRTIQVEIVGKLAGHILRSLVHT